jgi:hypothetical protein
MISLFLFVLVVYLAARANELRHERDQALAIASRRRTQRFVAETAFASLVGPRASHALEEAHQSAFGKPYINPHDGDIP